MTKQAEYQVRSQLAPTGAANTWTLIGTFSAPTIAYKVVNESNVGLDISTDGTNAHDRAPAESAYVWDIRTNHGREQQLAFPIGTPIYLRWASAATNSGLAYLCALNEGQ